jgi:hypothetical protein
MLNVSLTKKLADLLKYKSLPPEPSEMNPKYQWLGHVFIQNRKKYIIFINKQSCFCIVVPKHETSNVLETFKARLQHWLRVYRIPDEIAEEYLSHFENMNLTRAQDKKLLGVMNDSVYHGKWWVADLVDARGLKIDFVEIKLNKNPQLTMKCYFACEVFPAMFKPTPTVVKVMLR